MFSRVFLLDLLERAVATAAQAFLASLTVPLGWRDRLIVTGSAAGLSIVKGLAASRVGDRTTASLLP